MGLLTNQPKPEISQNEISCFKVMLKFGQKYYVCPPAYQVFKHKDYKLRTLLTSPSKDPERDYRDENGEVGENFYHTWVNLEDARIHKDNLIFRSMHPESIKSHPELYKIPEGGTIVILEASIPKGSLVYKGTYRQMGGGSYATNRIWYHKEFDDTRDYHYECVKGSHEMRKVSNKVFSSIKGFPDYTVTKDGKVFRAGKEIKSYDNGQGYRQVKLYKDGKRYTKNVHRLVMGEPSGDVDHKNCNKGDNKSSNLQNISHRDNVKRIFKKG